jgi:hypothetical protein
MASKYYIEKPSRIPENDYTSPALAIRSEDVRRLHPGQLIHASVVAVMPLTLI